MKKANGIVLSLLLLAAWIFLSGWGSKAHRIINRHAPASLPSQMSFLKTSWTVILADHASDADERRYTDPSESPRHYLNIDDYPGFLQSGRIPQTYDSVVMIYGVSFVLEQGILPWATEITFDSLRSCFQRQNWDKAALFAADLGHYIADGHQPLHLTKNYDGQYTGQDGIHSRYESTLVTRFETELDSYPDDPAQPVGNVNQCIFDYIYLDYLYVDSVLQADMNAQNQTGSHSSTAYYSAFWAGCGDFTTALFKDASLTLAGLIYTAWVQAGSPVPGSNGINDTEEENSGLLQNVPNPFRESTTITVEAKESDEPVSLKIYDSKGNLASTLVDGILPGGHHEYLWNGKGFSEGIYYVVLVTGNRTSARKMVLVR